MLWFRSSRNRQREWMSEGGGGGKGKSVPPSQTSHRRKHGCYNLFSWLSMKEKGSSTGAWVRLDPLPLTPTLSPICYLVFPAIYLPFFCSCSAFFDCHSESMRSHASLFNQPALLVGTVIISHTFQLLLVRSAVQCVPVLVFVFLLLHEYFWDDPSVGLSAAPESNL